MEMLERIELKAYDRATVGIEPYPSGNYLKGPYAEWSIEGKIGDFCKIPDGEKELLEVCGGKDGIFVGMNWNFESTGYTPAVPEGSWAFMLERDEEKALARWNAIPMTKDGTIFEKDLIAAGFVFSRFGFFPDGSPLPLDESERDRIVEKLYFNRFDGIEFEG